MEHIKKLMFKIVLLVSIVIFSCVRYEQVQAIEENMKYSDIEKKLSEYFENVNLENISKEEILKIYDDVIQICPPDTIADIIEENAKEIEEEGFSPDVISSITTFIKATNTNDLRKIIEDDIDFEQIKEKIEDGYTPEQVLDSVIQDTPMDKKIRIASKFILSNRIIKNIVTVLIVLIIYNIILRWRIYSKAGKPGIAAIIPIYNQIVMYQICGITPWIMLLYFFPFFGWMALGVISIVNKFYLARVFGHGTAFGFGLLFIPIIFKTILAFEPIKNESVDNNGIEIY